MCRSEWIYRPLAMMLLVLALASAPVVDVVTHGPGTLAAEADHAAWHAEKGDAGQIDSHQHHDSTDHDHGASGILVSQETDIFDTRTTAELCDQPSLSGAIRDGPRRPPREMV